MKEVDKLMLPINRRWSFKRRAGKHWNGWRWVRPGPVVGWRMVTRVTILNDGHVCIIPKEEI